MVTVSNNVVILARTRMNNGRVCVGGFDRDNNRYIRLLTENANNQNEDASYQVGQIYSVRYENRVQLVLPHCEDVCIQSSDLQQTLTVQELQNILIEIAFSNIHIRDLFGGQLNWENGSGFLLENNTNLPDYSVVVVSLNHDLFLYNDRRFRWPENNNDNNVFCVKYVGTDDISTRVISSGTYLRFSLARWWDAEGRYPIRRAYLQLSSIFG